MTTLNEMIEAVDLAIVRPIRRQNAINEVRKLMRRLDPEKPENLKQVAKIFRSAGLYSASLEQVRAILKSLTGDPR